MPPKIWVIGWDYGAEGGKSEPEMAFLSQEDAEAAKALIEKNPVSVHVYIAEVPVWKYGTAREEP
jgi:hypothetical protein